MKRRDFLINSSIFSFQAGRIHALEQGREQDKTIDRRPNVVLVFADQMRGQAMGCMGNPDVKTPRLDRLASEGIHFPSMFSNSPVCCVARATLLTGKYAHQHGLTANDLRLRESETTVAKLFARNGYRTGFIGKWHLDGGPRMPGFVPPGPRRQGFAYWAANECNHRHFDTQYFHDSPEPISINRFEIEEWFDLAIEFLRDNQNQPFFLVVALGPPHDPYDAPPQYKNLYDPEKLTLSPNWVKGIPHAGRKEIAAYYAAITAIDDQMARFLHVMDELNLSDDTIVLFTSDHGDMLGSQGLPLKRKPWEESIRVPGILRYPRKIKPNQVKQGLFSLVDVSPTLLSLCGIAPPSEMQGTDLSAYILGLRTESPESAFFQIFGPYRSGKVAEGWRGVRTSRFMYARTETAPWVLYDLEKDPNELKNLIGDPQSRQWLHLMDKKLIEWMRKTGDSWSYNWTEPVEDHAQLYSRKAFESVEEFLESNETPLDSVR